MRKTFFCIDAHTCGNPVRLVAGGGPVLLGESMMEKRLHFLKEYDWIRKGLMFEPRGHDMMSGSILYPPLDPENDIGVLFIETSGCLPMCGHGTIGTVTIAIEEGLVVPIIPGKLRLETPAGLVKIEFRKEGQKVKIPTEKELNFLNCWPENTLGHQEEAQAIRALLKLCKFTGFGRIPQLAQGIEAIWRDKKALETYRISKKKHFRLMGWDDPKDD